MRPRSQRYGGFGLVVLTLGGGMLLLASRPHSAALSASTRAIPAFNTECKKFWDDERDKTEANSGIGGDGGADLKLYRRDASHGKIDLSKAGKGGWVGGMHVKNADSKSFPSLKKDEMGCIWFHAWDGPGGLGHSAHLFHHKGGIALALNALYCDKHVMDRPYWGTVPDGCPKVQMFTGAATVEVERPQGGWTEKAFLDEIEAKLKLLGLPADVVKAFANTFGSNGPWFPCSEGCCRAT